MYPLLEDIAQLAPDDQSLDAARQSMNSRLWSGSGFSETAVWGQCEGNRTYEISIDLQRFGYRCNCPSRKRPCRHVLALLLRLATQPDSLVAGPPPEDVQQWLNQRRQREQQPRQAPSSQPKPVDKVAQAKRLARRNDRVGQGVRQLLCWIDDLIRNGLAGVELQDASFWEEQARRLVDAQAPGLANQVRAIGDIPASGAGWPARFLSALGRLGLLLHAMQRIDKLPEDLQSEVRQLCGWSISQNELEAHTDRQQDVWVVVAQQEEEQERLRVQKNWLIGMTSQRMALVLQFAPGITPFPELGRMGAAFSGTLQFYPGVTRLRARVLDQTSEEDLPLELPGLESIEQLLDQFTSQLTQSPWLISSVSVLKQATMSLSQGEWFIRDQSGEGLPISGEPPWQLLAETGNRPVDLVVEWDGETLRGLSWMHEGKLNAR